MAERNPKAIFRTPMTIDDYMAARMITSPLRLYDCDIPVDASTALVLSARETAPDLRKRPLEIEALGMSVGDIGFGHHVGDFTALPAVKAGEMLWSHTDLKPSDVDFAQLYDGFSILTLLWLEALQLCPRGEAARFVEGGKRIALDGELPINTAGGQLSAGRLHGYGYLHEACLQLWGEAHGRQVPNAQVGIACNGGFGYGAVLLKRP
jgi:acetyl-CoA acetyltransferase